MGRLALGIGGVAGKVAIGAAGGTLAYMIKSYFGFS